MKKISFVKLYLTLLKSEKAALFPKFYIYLITNKL